MIRREGSLVPPLRLIAQALAKAERSHEQDVRDVREMIAGGLVDPATARAHFESIDPATFRKVVEALFAISDERGSPGRDGYRSALPMDRCSMTALFQRGRL